MDIKDLILVYYVVFNVGCIDEMLIYLYDDFEYYVNEGQICCGKEMFCEFNVGMIWNYKEFLSDIVVFVNDVGDWVVVEFVVNGIYLNMDEGLFEVWGQIYVLFVGMFFILCDGKIVCVMIYYNLVDWMCQVLV